MLKNIIQRYFQLPLAIKSSLFTALVSLIACSLLIVASYQSSQQLIKLGSNYLGESLVTQLANNASNALVQGDKVSLQSLLSSLINNPLVGQASIFDVENHPIAEAGPIIDGPSYSASITLQDSIAGYAVITIDNSALRERCVTMAWQLLVTALFLTLFIYIACLIPSRKFSHILGQLEVASANPDPAKRQQQHIRYRGDDELQHLIQQVLTGPNQDSAADKQQPQGIMHIDLSAAIATGETPQLAVKCLPYLETLCRLYEGEIGVTRPNSFTVFFKCGEDGNSHAFRTICCAYLVSQSAQQGDLPAALAMGLVLSDPAQSTENATCFALARQQDIDHAQQLATAASQHGLKLLTNHELAEHPSVAERIVAATVVGQDYLNIAQLQEPYQALLSRQLNTLHNQRTNHAAKTASDEQRTDN